MGPTIPAELLNLNPGAVLIQEQANEDAGAIALPGVILTEGSKLRASSSIDRSTVTMYDGAPSKP